MSRGQLAAVACVAAALVGCGGTAHRGGFFGAGLGLAQSNFNLDVASDGDADVGLATELDAGFLWKNGFGLSGTLSAVSFEYSYAFARESDKRTLELTFATLEATAWTFRTLDKLWDFRAGVGLGASSGWVEDGPTDEDARGESLSFRAGVDRFISGNMALQLLGHVRYYGVAFGRPFLSDEVSTLGLTVGLTWR